MLEVTVLEPVSSEYRDDSPGWLQSYAAELSSLLAYLGVDALVETCDPADYLTLRRARPELLSLSEICYLSRNVAEAWDASYAVRPTPAAEDERAGDELAIAAARAVDALWE